MIMIMSMIRVGVGLRRLTSPGLELSLPGLARPGLPPALALFGEAVGEDVELGAPRGEARPLAAGLPMPLAGDNKAARDGDKRDGRERSSSSCWLSLAFSARSTTSRCACALTLA